MSERWSTGALIASGLAGITLSFLGSQVTITQQESANSALVREYDAVVQTVEAQAERIQMLENDLAMADEVLTQTWRQYEDGSGIVRAYEVGPDGFLHSYDVAVCEIGALCDN